MKKSKRALPPGGKGPLYMQLADVILSEIKQGALVPDSSLPTVRDLAEEMTLSVGTVKHAYDELERQGFIEKIRGRGTFVRLQDETQQGKKDRAMRLMDELIRDMQGLGFSVREIQIYFDLKMRSIEDIPGNARVLVVDCNPEVLYVISNQIAQLQGAQVQCRLLEDLSYVQGVVEDDPDVIVTTANHYDMVVQAAVREDRVCRVALSPSQSTVVRLAKTADSGRVGILCASNRFAWIIGTVCAELSPDISEIPHLLFGDNRAEDFLKSIDSVIVPDYYSRLCTPSDLSALRQFMDAGGSVIEFTYHIDAGSLMYLAQRIETVIAHKSE